MKAVLELDLYGDSSLSEAIESFQKVLGDHVNFAKCKNVHMCDSVRYVCYILSQLENIREQRRKQQDDTYKARYD